MKTSELIFKLTESLKLYGDNDINVNLLTENQYNIVKITGVYFNSKKNVDN